MNTKRTIGLLLIGLFGFVLTACGGQKSEGGTPDGVVKKGPTGKADRWNRENAPSQFETDLVREYKKLPDQGTVDKTVWADTYWPTYEDSINHRWQGDNTLSPVEKYDKAFNGWEPGEGFKELQPYDPEDCTWDEEYYERLGPAATHVAKQMGNWKAHNGKDDDGDGLSDKEECGMGEDADHDGVESWFGLCHAWVPAAMLEKEPTDPVTVNGVKFEVSDIKALIINKYDRAPAYSLGSRCNKKEVEASETGRIEDRGCRDTNAGSFHLIVTNFVGKMNRPFAEDRTYDYEVWNQPVVGYEITEKKEVSLDRVNELLELDDGSSDDEGLSRQDREGILKVANSASVSTLTGEVGLREDVAKDLQEFRTGPDGQFGTSDDNQFQSVEEIRNRDAAGERTTKRMLDYAQAQGWAPEPNEGIYKYNEDAEKFVEVNMNLEYVTESEASTEPTGPNLDRHIRTDRYHYLLELNGQGEIIGGEWIGESQKDHPDFLWLPTGARGGTPSIDIEQVRDLIKQSRSDSSGSGNSSSGSSNNGSESDVYSNNGSTSIPDNDPNGATSTIEVDGSGSIAGLKLSLNIEHTYRGDLLVQLTKKGEAGTSVTVFNGQEADGNSWEDDVKLEGKEVNGFENAEMTGTWELKVIDNARRDTGSIKSWKLEFETQ